MPAFTPAPVDDRLTKARLYRQRAAEARAKAETLPPGQAAHELLDIASDWEFLAARLERRAQEDPREAFTAKTGSSQP